MTPRRPAYTLIEMLVASASAGVLMVSMSSSLYIATQSLSINSGAAAEQTELRRATNRMMDDLRHATSFAERTTTALTFTVPDRSGDGLEETLRYAWSGVAGDPLTLEYNGASATTVIDGVTSLNLTYIERLMEAEVVEGSGTEAGSVVYEEFTEAKLAGNSISLAIDTPPGYAENDLLIAALATDGDSSASLTAPAGWNLIHVGHSTNDVSLGVWWKLAAASEASSHEFTWSPLERAYGWIMRFTGHDQAGPIEASAVLTGYDSSPTCDAVSTSTDNCLILRIGGFDDDDVTIDDAGMALHTTITMDESNESASTSGGAAYMTQEASGDGATANFALTGTEQYVTVTLAIKPGAAP